MTTTTHPLLDGLTPGDLIPCSRSYGYALTRRGWARDATANGRGRYFVLTRLGYRRGEP